MHDDDHFYGLGEKIRGQFDQTLDWRGRRRDPGRDGVTMGNHFEGNDGGANGNLMVPFLVTTRGAGMYLDTVYHTYWEFDDPNEASWQVMQDCDQSWDASIPKCQRSEMRFYLMVGDKPAQVINRYTELTGRPIMPPRWMMGFLQSSYGYTSWNEVNEVADSLRRNRFPVDAIFLDLQWFGGVPGAFSDGDQEAILDYSDCKFRHLGSLTWSKTSEFDFSGAAPHMANLASRGINVVPIEEGYFDNCQNGKDGSSNNFSVAEAAGYLARKTFDSTEAAIFANGDDVHDTDPHNVGYFGQDAMIDTAMPAARDWFWSKHLPILKDGAAAFWVDLGEPERYRWWWKYDGGLWHQDIHNVWELNRLRTLYDGFSRDLPERRPFAMARSGYAGIQRFGAAIWSADVPSRLGWAAAQPSAHMNLGISGIPYATSDIGGFAGVPISNGDQYVRWLQLEVFSPIARSHGNRKAGHGLERIVEPDGFGEPYTSINRTYLNWRESLVPYLYTLAREAYDTGMPIERALPLEWPRDRNVQDLGSEFMCGSAILVAPVLLGETNEPALARDIYLPEGQWVDMHDGVTYQGGQWLRNFPAPLAKLPLFARAGAILPKAPAAASVSDPAWNLTRIFEIYPHVDGSSYDLYDDDGQSNAYKHGEDHHALTHVEAHLADNRLTVTVGPMQGSYKGMPERRGYALDVHSDSLPRAIVWSGGRLAVRSSDTEHLAANVLDAVWNSKLKKVFVHFPDESVATSQSYEIEF